MILPVLLNKTKLLPVYVVGIGNHEAQDHVRRPFGFQSYQFLYCLSGSGILKIEDKEHQISAGDAFFFRPDVPHEYYPTEEPWSVRWVVFAGNGVENIMDYLSFGKSEVFPLHNPEELNIQLDAMADIFWCDDPDKEIKTSTLMYKLMVKMGECRNNLLQPDGKTRNARYEKLSPVIEMLKTRYREDISLQDMATTIGVTTNHLCRLFHRVYGTTPLKYLTHLRLNMAKYHLSSSAAWRIKDVATAVGFKDPSYFCAVFKKAEGMTPEEFRRVNTF